MNEKDIFDIMSRNYPQGDIFSVGVVNEFANSVLRDIIKKCALDIVQRVCIYYLLKSIPFDVQMLDGGDDVKTALLRIRAEQIMSIVRNDFDKTLMADFIC